MTEINRVHKSFEVTIAAGESESSELEAAKFSLLLVHVPAGWETANIGFKVRNPGGTAWRPLCDELGSLVQISNPGGGTAYTMPAELAVAHHMKLWSQSGGTAVAQGTARTLFVDAKG